MKNKIVKIKETFVDEMVDILEGNSGKVKNALLVYEIDGHLHFIHSKLESRAEMIGLIEYAKHGILEE